jgi:hypothetical protein
VATCARMVEGELLLLVGAHLILTALPGVAATLCAARLGVERVPILLAIGLAATGIVAMLAFWSYYGARELGETFSYLVVFGSIATIVGCLWGGRIDRDLLRALAIPLSLWALGSAFLVFLGFLHGGSDTALATASTRFSGALPNDNDIPNFYTEWFFLKGHSEAVPPYAGDWLFSDRPPLQVGYMLTQRGFGWDNHGLNYQLLGVILQQLWIVALWALLLAARLGRLTRGLIMGTVLVSDLAIVNGFFVWPKMLPAALLIAAAALVMTPLWEEVRRSLWGAVLVAALLGLAMLGHGSSVFGVVPLAMIAAVRSLPSWRWIGVGVLVGVALMGSWSAYQKYEDPPGNRLTKWMLAGAVEIDDRGSLEAIADGYSEAGLGGTLHNKGQNFVTIAGGGPALEIVDRAIDEVGNGEVTQPMRELRSMFFFYLLPSLGLLLIAPIVMALARGRGRERAIEWRFALTCFFVFAVGSIAWALILFGSLPARTVIHAGTYAIPILGFCGAVAGLRATFPRFAVWFVAINAALMLALYTPSLDPPPGTSYSALAALLAAAGLAGFLATLWLEPAASREAAPSPALPAEG